MAAFSNGNNEIKKNNGNRLVFADAETWKVPITPMPMPIDLHISIIKQAGGLLNSRFLKFNRGRRLFKWNILTRLRYYQLEGYTYHWY